jgi:hypothetical protein
MKNVVINKTRKKLISFLKNVKTFRLNLLKNFKKLLIMKTAILMNTIKIKNAKETVRI